MTKGTTKARRHKRIINQNYWGIMVSDGVGQGGGLKVRAPTTLW
jgi:hypothetical protein